MQQGDNSPVQILEIPGRASGPWSADHFQWSFASLADPSNVSPRQAQALRHIFRAMSTNPVMVAGPGRFDTALMEVAGGNIVSKGGAEGYEAMALAPGLLGKGTPGVGIVFKVSDGDSTDRVRPLVAVEILRQLGALTEEQANHLAQFQPRPLYNFRKMEVGTIRPCFILEKRPVYYGS